MATDIISSVERDALERFLTLDELRDRPALTIRDLDGHEVVPPPIAGKVLTLGRNASYEACKRGEIPSIRVGGRVLVPVARLRAMVEGDGGAA